jgi:hypothetical protein
VGDLEISPQTFQVCISSVCLIDVCLMGVYLTGVHLMGVHLMGIHFMGMHLIGVHVTGMCLTGVHLVGVHVTGVHLMDVHLTGVHLIGMYLNGRAPHRRISHVLRAADRYAYTGHESTACSVGTVYGGKGDLYTPDARPALPHWRHPVGDALHAPPATPCSQAQADYVCRIATETRPIRNIMGVYLTACTS